MTTENAARQRSTPPQQGRRSGRVWYGTAVLIALVWLAAAGPLGSFMGALTDVQTNDSSAFLPIGAESSEVQEAQEAFKDSGAIPAIVVYSATEPIARDGLAAIAKDAERIGARPWVEGAVAGPIPGTEDQRVAQLIVPVGEQADVRAAVDELRGLLADSELPDATVQVAGPAALSSDLGAAFGGIDGALLGVALGAVLIILIAVYRSPLLPFVVIMAAMLALVLAAAVVYLMADAGWIQLNGQSQGILFILVVGACTDYALLLVARYREELYERERPIEAMRIAVRGTIEPILASGGTVILGVLCLLASDLASNRGLGPVAALGIGAALISALTFLPAVLLLLGRAAFWPVKPRQTATTDVSARHHRRHRDRHRHHPRQRDRRRHDRRRRPAQSAVGADRHGRRPAAPGLLGRDDRPAGRGGRVRADVPRRGHLAARRVPYRGRVGPRPADAGARLRLQRLGHPRHHRHRRGPGGRGDRRRQERPRGDRGDPRR